MILKGKNIVITGIQSWDINIGSNCKNIALEFAKHNRVIYVNPPLDLSTLLRRNKSDEVKKHLEVIRSKKGNLFRVSKNLWVLYPKPVMFSISKVPFNRLFDFFNKVNNKRFAKSIKKALKRNNMTFYYHFCDSDIFRSYHLKELLMPLKYIYYTRDNLKAVPFWKKHGSRIEPKHMAKADIVVSNSEYLAQAARKFNDKSYFVGQGCNLNSFYSIQADATPNELDNVRGPIVGYIGALNSKRLNINLIETLAKSRPEWNIVLIGPQDDEFKNSNLQKTQNIVFIDAIPEYEIPRYLKAFDVAINPQLVNELTIGNYPRKIDEYLAMGKPVVATKTLTMEYFLPHVLLAETDADWLINIEHCLKENSFELQKQRSLFALKHSWANNVNNIYTKILKSA